MTITFSTITSPHSNTIETFKMTCDKTEQPSTRLTMQLLDALLILRWFDLQLDPPFQESPNDEQRALRRDAEAVVNEFIRERYPVLKRLKGGK